MPIDTTVPDPGADLPVEGPGRARRLLDDSWQRIRQLRRRRAGPGRAALDLAPDLPRRDVRQLRELLADLLARHDTASQRSRAALVADAYVGLDDTGRRRFLELVAGELGVDPDRVDAAIDRVRDAAGGTERREAEQGLREALVPSSARLLHLFLGLPSGVKFLVDLRADLLRLGRDDPALAGIDAELRGHLATLFDVGLLDLRRITWDAPASLLEKLAAYEAVHRIESWVDLKNRLTEDQRWDAFFHPAMPDEPLIFVEIALTRGMATELPPLLDEQAPAVAPEDADTAIFYSISNCQPGLAGVNLGNALIKQVVDQLRRDLPNLGVFATLSPVPGFAPWLDDRLARRELLPAERAGLPVDEDALRGRLATSDWPHDGRFADAIRAPLLTLCARFLLGSGPGRAPDPVANFHLANGAAVERVNWLADPGPHGLRRSIGIMVNYRYEPDRITQRAEAYVADGTIARSAEVDRLLAP